LNVRNQELVLTYVETGNADAGIVYGTDARESEKVRIAETAREGDHAPVVYPIAMVRESRNITAAREFINFLAANDARSVFARHGFTRFHSDPDDFSCRIRRAAPDKVSCILHDIVVE
jgi:molybdenum ABC transporter molybdate-binding protein